MEIKEIEINKIIIDEEQPRKDLINLGELSSSISKEGLMQPIEVRPFGNNTYKIIDGERRFRACSLLKHKTINCIIYTGKRDIFIRQLATDFLKEKLNLVEQAEAIKKLINEGMTIEDVRIELGLQKGKIYLLRKILNFNDRTKKLISEGKLTQNIIANISKSDIEKEDEDKIIDDIIKKRAKSRNQIDKIVYSISDLRYVVNNFLSYQYSFECKVDEFNSFLRNKKRLIDKTINDTIKSNDDSLKNLLLILKERIDKILDKIKKTKSGENNSSPR